MLPAPDLEGLFQRVPSQQDTAKGKQKIPFAEDGPQQNKQQVNHQYKRIGQGNECKNP
jgi:hypothetical protein